MNDADGATAQAWREFDTSEDSSLVPLKPALPRSALGGIKDTEIRVMFEIKTSPLSAAIHLCREMFTGAAAGHPNVVESSAKIRLRASAD
jgi:hypothetical protein